MCGSPTDSNPVIKETAGNQAQRGSDEEHLVPPFFSFFNVIAGKKVSILPWLVVEYWFCGQLNFCDTLMVAWKQTGVN